MGEISLLTNKRLHDEHNFSFNLGLMLINTSSNSYNGKGVILPFVEGEEIFKQGGNYGFRYNSYLDYRWWYRRFACRRVDQRRQVRFVCCDPRGHIGRVPWRLDRSEERRVGEEG